MTVRPDVAIVGGGPAGSWAAWRLARAGARVVVFDHSHPREKPCGGGVTGRALGLVRDALAGVALAGVDVDTAIFDEPGVRPARVSLDAAGVSSDSSLVVVDRERFDHALLDAARVAGAEHVADRVMDVDADASGVRVRTRSAEWRADRLLGADGANSLARRRLFRPFRRDQISIAVGVFAHGVTSREILIRFVARPQGYIWSFPRRDHLAIGVCAQADESTSGELKTIVDAWLAETRVAEGARLEPYGWPIPSLGAGDFDTEQAAGDRWALAGDAAGLVDPITREGIFFALESGRFAADAILESRGLAAYEARLRDTVYPELRRAARLKRGFFRSGFTRLLIEALAQSAPVSGIMADLVAGRQPYSSLKRRLLTTFELGLAWRLLKMEVAGR